MDWANCGQFFGVRGTNITPDKLVFSIYRSALAGSLDLLVLVNVFEGETGSHTGESGTLKFQTAWW